MLIRPSFHLQVPRGLSLLLALALVIYPPWMFTKHYEGVHSASREVGGNFPGFEETPPLQGGGEVEVISLGTGRSASHPSRASISPPDSDDRVRAGIGHT